MVSRGQSLGTATLDLRADSSNLDAGIERAKGGIGTFGKIAAGAAIAGTAAIAGIGLASVKMAADFEKSFAEVKTLLPDLSEQAFGKMERDLLSFSKEMGIATNQAVPALYQAISAGVPPDNVMSFMETAAKASIGGVTDLETAVDGITSVVNAYGAETISAERAADVMFAGVRAGKTDFEQLSRSLFNVIPTASSLGISFEEVTAALATMTAQGVPTSVATTQLRQAFVEASKGGTRLDTAIKALHGEGFAGLIERGMTATDIFQSLRETMPEQEFKDLFGSVEAMNAALQITGPNLDTMNANLESARNSAGSLDQAFETVSQTASFQFGKAINQIKVMMIELGSVVLPLITNFLINVLIPGLSRASEWMGTLGRAVGNVIDTIKAIASGDVWRAFEPLAKLGLNAEQILLVSGALMKVREALVAFGDILKATVLPVLRQFTDYILGNETILKGLAIAIGVGLVVAFGALAVAAGSAAVSVIAALAPVIAIGLAIGALVAGLIYAYTEFETFRNIVDAVAGALVDFGGWVVSTFTGTVIPAFQSFGQVAGEAIGWVVEQFRKFGNDVLPALENVASGILSFISVALLPLQVAIGVLVTVFRDNFTEIANVVKAGMNQAWNVIRTVLELIRDTISVALALLRGDWEGAWNGIKTLLSNVWDNMVSLVRGQIEIMRSVIDLALGVIKTLMSTAWDVIKSATSAAWEAVKSIISDAWNGAVSAVKGVWENDFRPFIASIPGAILDALGDLGSLLVGLGKALIDGLASGARDAWASARTWLQNLPTNIKAALGDLSRLLWSIGSDIINGLWGGMKAKWGEVAGWLGGIGGTIKSLKGPLDKDRVLLVPEGTAIMQGLADGMERGFNTDVRYVIADVFTQLPEWVQNAILRDGRLVGIGRQVGEQVASGVSASAGAVSAAVAALMAMIPTSIPMPSIAPAPTGLGVGAPLAPPAPVIEPAWLAQLNQTERILMGLPRLNSGGIVPGPIGAPTLAIVHGGETVLPTHQRGFSTGNTYNFHIEAPDPEAAGRYVEDALVSLQRRGIVQPGTVMR